MIRYDPFCAAELYVTTYTLTAAAARWNRARSNRGLPARFWMAIVYGLMATKLPHPIVTKLKKWRAINNLSQSQAVRVLVEAGLPVALTTLQQWEIARSSPRPLMVAAIARFLAEKDKLSTKSGQKAIAPVIERLKAWREANNLSQSQAVRLLNAAGLPAKVKTLQGWEIGRHSPQAITAVAIERFLDQQPPHPSPLHSPHPQSAAHHSSDSE